MRTTLLSLLADPATGEPLELVGDPAQGDVEEGELRSPSGRCYPIVRGVPRFVSGDSYSASFALQWNRFARVQLDSWTGTTRSHDRFVGETGWGEADISGRWIVDAGCGAGRFAEVAAAFGANVLAVDLSGAVDAARANLGHLPNVHPVQADIRHLPLRRDLVDALYCIGVLQHTPDPYATAISLVSFLRQGAQFRFTAYGRRPWTPLYGKYLLRPLTRRIRSDRLLRAVEKAMPVLFPLTSALFSAPALGKVFQFVIPVANYVWATDLPRGVRYQEAILDTFDMLAPRYDRPLRTAALVDALRGLTSDLEIASEAPVVVRGRRA